ncbi:MAG: LysE family transporter [Bradyrhizobium sp.]|uniref:LysE family translocator n=1 Tax=Bradyrhizobium sp. TaxID=376 RepID=UPI001D432457|nr:LysE family transporter [Bradyrhizobium sp.]MBV9560513.1 LysE family transporter [Bradyrhizobium sp.]
MPFAQTIAALASGAGIGFTVAAPIGPMGMLCVQRTLACSTAAGLVTGLGAATVHLAYSAIAIIGLGSLAQTWMQANGLALGALSGVAMLWFAVRAHRSGNSVRRAGEIDRTRLTRAYLSAIAIGFSNPMTIVLFFAASNAFANQSAAPSLVAGVFLGSTAWWIILSTVVGTARSRFDANTLALSSQLASLMLLFLGVFTLLRIAVKALSNA